MKLKNINKIYHNINNDVEALKNINVTIPNKGMTFILGASGCGKTTLLNIISGQDKDYSGLIEYNGKIEAITQEIQLFENLSILDNLLLVSDDKEKIDTLLTRFGLNYSRQIVKKLSTGEKRRVQIIRSLLAKSTCLICDEPTASLNHENSQLVMDMLKELSKEMSVVVVTHHIALVDQYADFIIKMGKGVILDQSIICQADNDDVYGKEVLKQQISKHIFFLFKDFKSRWSEHFFTSILLFSSILVVFISIYVFPSLNSTVMATSNWLNGKNIIITQPNEGNNSNSWYTDAYYSANVPYNFYYDLYNKEDIYFVKEQLPEIWGYRYEFRRGGYCTTIDDTSYIPFVSVEKASAVVEQYLDEYLETGVSPFFGYEWMIDDLKYYESLNLNEQEQKDYTIADYSNLLGLKSNVIGTAVIPELSSVCIFDRRTDIEAYQLFEGVQLPMMYGQMPQNLDQIVISKNVAEKLVDVYDLNSIEELIGKEINFNMEMSSGNSKCYIGYDYIKKYPITVSGITFMECQYENQVFFLDGGFEKLYVELYDFNPEISTYVYVRFLGDPLADGKVLAEQINRLLESNESRFYQYSSMNVDASEIYQDTRIISIFIIFAMFAIISFYMIMQVLLNKRIVKENNILQRYHYKVLLIQMTKLAVLLALSGLIQFSVLSSICDGLNGLANSLGIANIVEYDLITYLKAVSLTAICFVLLEGGTYAFRIKKYS